MRIASNPPASAAGGSGFSLLANWWARAEVPTFMVALVVYGGWLLLTWYGQLLPWWILAALGGGGVCLHGSLQHEIVHGHPTSNKNINTLLALPPLALWMPYLIYRDTHIAHHKSGHLTCPRRDPESFYVNADRWAQMNALKKATLRLNNTLAGRLTLGPVLAIAGFWGRELRRIAGGDLRYARVWVAHLLGCVVVLAWVAGFCGMPIWQYLLLFVWPGLSLTLLRSYTEHRPAPEQAYRTAVVEACLPLRLLFLNNNYHALHHEQPGVPWYELRTRYQSARDEILHRNRAFVFRGYGEVFRRYTLVRKDEPVHALNDQARARHRGEKCG
ncbi:MAG: fatty acid desaturase, partial [Gammaproteobacteria bacterium]